MEPMDQFEHFIAIAAEGCLLEDVPHTEDLDPSKVEFSPRYYRKKRKAIRKYRYLCFKRKYSKYFERTAICVLSLILLATLAVACVPKIRKTVYKSIIELKDSHISIHYEEENKEDEEEITVEIPKVPTSILAVKKPRVQPEKYTEVKKIGPLNSVAFDYYLEKELAFSFSQNLISTTRVYPSGQGQAVVTEAMIGTRRATAVTYKNSSQIYLLWNDGEYSYELKTNALSLKELLEIAKKVD